MPPHTTLTETIFTLYTIMSNIYKENEYRVCMGDYNTDVIL